MRQLQPPAIRVLDPDPNQLTIAFQAAPNALLLPRDWALSEQHDDVRRDPVGTGKRHAQDWRGKIDRWRASGTPLPSDKQIVVVGINEAQVWTMLPQTVEYNVAMLDECTRLGLRACALNLSVGWPANTGPDTPPDWTPYAPIEAAIKRGNHILVLHSYWYKSGPQDGAGWWAWRHRACPWDVPIIIGECGVDNYVDMQRWENDGKPNRGWRGNISPDQYAAQMEAYARGCDRRVIAILPFLTDYRSNNWESFDTAEAHPHFLARANDMVPQVAPPATKPPVGTQPQPPAKTTPMWVQAPAGANLRLNPVTGDILTAIPYGAQVDALDNDDDAGWLIVRYEGITGWVRADLLQGEPVTPQPTPTPVDGDNFARCIAFVRRWEGGWADDPNDVGGATNKGITLGTYTAWREQHGQPPPTKEDLRNISDEETDRIYFERYWKPSGAHELPWPLCLAQFDTSVNAGVGKALEMLRKSDENFLKYVGYVGIWYTGLAKFEHFGRAWARRRFELLLEAAK